MYSIATVIYGIPLTRKISNKIQEWEKDQDEERWFETSDGVCGFTTMYSGSADGLVGYCGVELDKFNECCDFVDPSKLKMEPTAVQKKKAEAKIAKLDPDIKKLAEKPGVYFVWSTS